ncbi:uncharacterized protein FOMMEDRAFT_148194 [Fomitiporia mediterranea MF3/22]|uniref:uncharacterized protein n=1 Tax=Fomitiporia mediterranea (strain MF3/22) TaxID=694068 RepID=UPI000440902E|nr:uncharacterized protein FOMMEDRAFT_148194 [Fomitiporia mediterranea MF3/22]EJD00365.1 hypothetical protein FOMMEDRAFT_148194 [Fomitiporia mediterranea MF3/22]
MRITSGSLVFVTLFGAAAAAGYSKGVSKGPSGSHTWSTPTPTPTPKPQKCKWGPVECCAGHTESDSTLGQSILGQFSIPKPSSAVEIGYNCTSHTDSDINEGVCGHNVYCCQKIYNGTLPGGKNTTVGVDCADVAI